MKFRGQYWVLLVVGLVALRLPTLRWGFGMDDYTHQAVLDGWAEHPTLRPWSLFDFGSPPGPGEALYEMGGWPFWSDESFRARFFRPLSSLSVALDHKLFGSEPLGYHVVQIGLFALLLVLLMRLWRALGVTPGVALLALAAFGLEDGSTAAVGWIANRNTLWVALSLVAGLLALRRNSTPGVVVAGLCALAAKESGIGVVLVLSVAAYYGLASRSGEDVEVHTGLDGRRPRLAIALGAIAIAYAGAYVAFGYGARSSFYATPWSDAQTFFGNLALHLTAVLGSAAGPLMTDAAIFQPQARPLILGLGAVVVAALARPIARTVRQHPAGKLFAAIGVLTFAPQVFATPSDRLVLVPMIGWAPLLALTVHRCLSAGGRHRLGGRVLIASMLVLSPLAMLAVHNAFEQQILFARSVLPAADVGARELGRREVFVLQPPIGPLMLSVAPQYAAQTGDDEVRWWGLQNGRRGLSITRTGSRSMEIESTDEAFLTLPFEYLYRTEKKPPEVGRKYAMAFFRAEVLSVDEGGMRRFSIEANDDLDAPHVRFLAWNGTRMAHLAPPAVGETLELPRAREPFPFAP